MEKAQDVVSGQKKGISLGIGALGIELNISLDIYGIRTLADTLSNALTQTAEAATETVNKVVDTVQELGVENLKKWAQEGGEEVQNAYRQLVSQLQEAAQRGEEKARDLLQSLGEGVESAGQKIQDVASEEKEVRH